MLKNFQKNVFFLSVAYALCVDAALYYPNGNLLSLVNDIASANSTLEDDIVDLGGFIYSFDGITPALFANDDGAFSALPMITTNSGKLSIINGTIQRSFSTLIEFRIMYNNGDLTLYNITLENGSVTNYNGGCIYNVGKITLNTCIISSNAANLGADPESGNGGALYNAAGIINAINNTIISKNAATGHAGGAGIFNAMGTINLINNSTISDNILSSDGGGGGISNFRGVIDEISNTTISKNSASTGGGIVNLQGQINTIVNSTIFGNEVTTGGGGGIFNFFSTISALTNTTISGNSANDPIGGTGGGIYNFGTISKLISNIVAGNTAGASGPDIYNADTISIEGYNLLSDASNSSITNGINNDIVQANANLYLGPLQDNGGPTFTIALLPGSFAINNGNNRENNLVFDQRGPNYRRVICAMPDIGAFERQYCSL